MATHFTYNSAPSKLNKKELYEEYIKLVEHSKKNDFLVSCSSPMPRTQKNHYKAMEDMIKSQKNMIKVYEERKDISDSLLKDYDDKIEYLENKIADMENMLEEECSGWEHKYNVAQEDLKKFKECALKIRKELSDSGSDEEDLVEYSCKGCDNRTISSKSEYNCSEGVCEDCQKYL